jgi:hypothetical protein
MILNDKNFLIYAAKFYNNSQCLETQEFYDDLCRFKYLKRLFKRYKDTGDLKERLILNHIIVIYNVFGVEAATSMLFLKMRGFHEYLKPFLVFLGYMPEKVKYGETEVRESDITMDLPIVAILRKI